MIRRSIVTICILLCAVGGAVAYKMWPRTVPLAECSEVYRRYADTPGINAAYIKDYRVNDSVTVCVTLLEALDSSSWDSLKNDFKIEAVLDSMYKVHGPIEINETTKNMRLAPKCDYNLPKDSIFTNNDFIVTTFYRHIICIFHLENKDQYHAIRNKQFDEIKPKF